MSAPNQNKFLKVRDQSILDQNNRPVILKGVNLGGWLMMEAYILHAPNIAEQVFKKNFARALGRDELISFEKEFRDHFIREDDIRRIAQWGFNCIRLPFNFRLIEPVPGHYSDEGLGYLKRAVDWCKRHGLWVILDLHAAPGAQNHDWHSDSLGPALLWNKKEFQNRTLRLWEFLADHFKDEPAVAGYDLLNEAVLQDTTLLNSFYRQLIKTIRQVDRRHIVFIEGNHWAQDLDCLEDFPDEQSVLSIHAYQPLEFTFNFIPHLHYPEKSQIGTWNKKILQGLLSKYKKISVRRNRPVFVGEFGVNARQGLYGEDQWVKDMTEIFAEFRFHWTYWTYKAVKNGVLPDGILSYMDNPAWINRAGPRSGWDVYSEWWTKKKTEMVSSWKSENFIENTPILNVLRHAAHQ